MLLTEKEQFAQKLFISKLKIRRRITKKPIIVAMIGLVGSGKSSVAKELAKSIGAIVVESDKIRVQLRKINENYNHLQQITENITKQIIKKGGNVILDSDFINLEKRQGLNKISKKVKARLINLHVYCVEKNNKIPGINFDVMIGRIISGSYKLTDFFGGARSAWLGDKKYKGAIVKLREMIRRLPQYYQWENKISGRWILKRLPIRFFVQINTADEKNYKKEIKKIAERLNKL